MKKNNYFFNFLKSYNKIFFKVVYYEIIYSIWFKEFLPKIKIQNNSKRTDTVPCIYYFLREISKFIKKNKIKSIADIGSGYGRVLNYISLKNNIKCYGIEYDYDVFRSALKTKKEKVKLYCGNALTFNIKKFNSRCFILIDPFKKKDDMKNFLSKIKKLYPKKTKYIILVNYKKTILLKNFKLIKQINGSKTRNLKFYSVI